MFLTHKYATYECPFVRIYQFSCNCCFYSTFRDDVADHEKWSKELGCSRILHSEEVRLLNFQRNLNEINTNTHTHTHMPALFLEDPVELDVSTAVTWLPVIHLFDKYWLPI